LHPPAAQELVATDVAQPAATLTQAPLHRANPLPQTNVHALSTHVAWPFPTLAQRLPHAEQSFALVVVSTHVFAHTVGAVDGQVAMQANVPLALLQSGVLPVHVFPQLPQLDALEGSTQPSAHARRPAAQMGTAAPASAGVGAPLSFAGALPPPSVHPFEQVPAAKPSSPEMTAHAPSTTAATAAVANRAKGCTILFSYGRTENASQASTVLLARGKPRRLTLLRPSFAPPSPPFRHPSLRTSRCDHVRTAMPTEVLAHAD
jgi:hypothetical protein